MIVWFLILFIKGIDSFPSGAPESACLTLTPRHSDITPQTSKEPYQIHAELSGEKITAYISSSVGEKFEGFIMQVRSSKNPSQFIDGEFTSSPVSKPINCFGSNQNTLTHVNNEPKMEIMTEWTPREPLKEAIIFRATIVKQYDVFWTEIDSNSVNQGNNSMTFIEEESLYENCFKREVCLGMPSNCIEREDCEVLLRYHKSADAIEFMLQGPLETSWYMAMAFSEDDIMDEDSVTECIRDGTDVIARESWNVGKRNTRTRDLDKKQYIGTYVDGWTSCSWSTPLIYVSNEQTYNFIRNTYHILLATGEITQWRLRYHYMRLASSEALNLTNFSDPEVENSSLKTTEFQHPPTTPGYDSTSQKESSNDNSNSRSSCLNVSFVLFIFGLFFAARKNIVYF